MAVARDGELCGSIGGGVMEVRLVEQAKTLLQDPHFNVGSEIVEQVHQKHKANASGMICSGKQTVIFRVLTGENAETVASIIDSIEKRTDAFLTITPNRFNVETPRDSTGNDDFYFTKHGEEFTYTERLGPKNSLYIIGGGHCSLALSDLMSQVDFRISVFVDRSELNTLDKNRFADRIETI